MSIWVVISTKCSPLGFGDVNVLGSFVNEEDAKQFKKSRLIEIADNYKISVKKSWLELRKSILEPPEDVKLGYTVS